ncbi:MAG: alpha/beta fold hydrolase [Bacteriovoracaceae bacterium]|nr:alpha/beta fold hydrolase [Bacteriovoracaceae bacterium]
MNIKVTKTLLTLPWCETQALAFIPSEIKHSARVIYSHGYTASKADCLPWAIRAADSGVPAIIFDWPGHFLGGMNDVENFLDFKLHAHELFAVAFERLNTLIGESTLPDQVVLGGHSLGALMAIKAMSLPQFSTCKRLGVGVGIGLNNKVETHLFDTQFYQKTLSIRRQLVSPALDSDHVFPWIREEKTQLQISGERIHLIVGEDDMVVGAGGMDSMAKVLEEHGNQVTTYAPKKLAHHEPTLAAPHLHAFLKQELGWS